MHLSTVQSPEAATGNSKLATEKTDKTDKKGYGAHWNVGTRTVDNWLALGLPHMKIGERMVRIDIPEADAWMRERFGTQRRGKVGAV